MKKRLKCKVKRVLKRKRKRSQKVQPVARQLPPAHKLLLERFHKWQETHTTELLVAYMTSELRNSLYGFFSCTVIEAKNALPDTIYLKTRKAIGEPYVFYQINAL